MRKVYIIGIGPGNPDYMTIQAINALNQVDVFFIPDKGAEKAGLRQFRTEICDRFIKDRVYRLVDVKTPERGKTFSDYKSNVTEWHVRIEAIYADLVAGELADGECGAFLVWGDPSLYDSTLRIVEAIHAKGLGFEYEVIPGVTSVQVLAAKHRVPLNRIGEPVLITTGRKLAEGLADDQRNVVVLLDGAQAFSRIEGNEFDIFWGASLGTADEVVISGRLNDVVNDIKIAREEVRRKQGWVMDTYLLRRSDRT
jgi:precorrin-6A synthase